MSRRRETRGKLGLLAIVAMMANRGFEKADGSKSVLKLNARAVASGHSRKGGA